MFLAALTAVSAAKPGEAGGDGVYGKNGFCRAAKRRLFRFMDFIKPVF